MIQDGEIRVEGGASNVKTGGANLNDGDWHHVAVTFAEADTSLNQCKLYVDGVELAIATNFNGGTLILTSDASPMRVGQAIYGNDHFFRNGALDDVRVYAEELSAEQLLAVAGLSSDQAPVADFTVDKTSVYAGELVTFSDLSTGSNDTLIWDFDGGVGTSLTDSTSQVAFPSAGTYSISLVVNNTGGVDTLTRTDYVNVTENPGSGDLQAQFTFEGNIDDASSYVRHLTPQGNLEPVYTEDNNGTANSAYAASGIYEDHMINGYVGIGGDKERTVTAWFRTTSSGRATIPSWGKNSSGQMFNVMIDGGIPRVEGGASSLRTADTGLNDSTWHHIAVTYNPVDGPFLQNVKVYVDGVLSENLPDSPGMSFNSETTQVSTDTTTNLLRLSSAVYTPHFFSGAFDDVRIYSRALSESEVNAVLEEGVTTGLSKGVFKDAEISIFPNPVSEWLMIKTSLQESFIIRVYDAMGHLVYTDTTGDEPGRTTIEMGRFPTGLYHLVFIEENGSHSAKIVKN